MGRSEDSEWRGMEKSLHSVIGQLYHKVGLHVAERLQKRRSCAEQKAVGEQSYENTFYKTSLRGLPKKTLLPG